MDAMRAMACREAEFDLVERPRPEPGPGQVRIEVSRCGICGSDLHARHGIDQWAELAAKVGYDRFGRSEQEIVFGHEFSGRVAEYGPGCRADVASGAAVVALPLLRNADGIDTTGLSEHAPGAYAEEALVQESMMMAVPNGLDQSVAALTEPMAVALHAVRRGEVGKRQVAIVIGCGPVGLGVILMLKATGVRTVIAADYSPGRRGLAERCGADLVVDPSQGSPYEPHGDPGWFSSLPDVLDLALDTREKLERLPGLDWRHLWRLGEKAGLGPKNPVIFECVGVPGVLAEIIDAAPLFSRIVVAGVCVGPDTFTPALAINKEVELRFVLGYTPLEFRDTLHMLADGKVDPRPMITGTVGLAGVPGAFSDLADPESHAKILIDPALP